MLIGDARPAIAPSIPVATVTSRTSPRAETDARAALSTGDAPVEGVPTETVGTAVTAVALSAVSGADPSGSSLAAGPTLAGGKGGAVGTGRTSSRLAACMAAGDRASTVSVPIPVSVAAGFIGRTGRISATRRSAPKI